MIALPNFAADTDENEYMSTGDITVTLTMAEHEILNDMINHTLEAIQLVAPYSSGLHDLPLDNEIVQRISTIDNLRDRFSTLWAYRFNDSESIELLDIKAKISRENNPDNPQYTDEELDAMCHVVR
jgi:hypothetical protein